MRFHKRPGFLWLVALVLLPWPVDYWYKTVEDRQHARDRELFRRHDCGYDDKNPCPAADFDGDGRPAELRIVQPGKPRHEFLSVVDGGKELLLLPHANIDNTLRTHRAVSFDSGAPRLLIYDGASHQPPLRTAYAFDGRGLSEAEPTPLEKEILRGMAAFDDTGTLHGRVFADIRRLFRFMAYYTLLTVLTCVLWWNGAGSPIPPHHAQLQPPRGNR